MTPTPTTSPTDDEGLSAGEIAGIVIGSVIGALLLIIILVIIIYCICKRFRGTGRYAFVEKGIPPKVQDDDFTVQNVYYEPRPPSPDEGSVHSMKLKFAQESESSGGEDDDNDAEGSDEGQKEKKRVSQAAGGLEKEMLEMSEETHL
ncbi:PREDICTED: uncharacterized protein LOC109580447 [Amphimedon queenslandica]|uniref:Uncharacterized protein n=1 Tax=Amphimedon queenslandica TaxID=400682 RepID=A0AAN0IX73_AMPQE|nr:PREDICTED: uncharacterized protein LOC109580447 [Amphimedon queenslandica]|eukprot:XP_019849157.1 PREDICTED: uncharacterized protein LOC109580447 [Amphimedon queenslandica]